jgi:hypothetical protein
MAYPKRGNRKHRKSCPEPLFSDPEGSYLPHRLLAEHVVPLSLITRIMWDNVFMFGVSSLREDSQ